MKFLRSSDKVGIHKKRCKFCLLAQILSSNKQQYLDDMKYFSQEGLILLFVIAELFPCFLGPGLKRHQKGLIFEEHFLSYISN